MEPPALPPLLDLAGTAVFALTGALGAARMRQTFITMIFFALITGVGGGTVRDLLIGEPVFWLRDPWIAPVILATAVVAWFTPSRWWAGKLLLWGDAAGLAAYSVLGTAKALAFGVAPIPAAIVGVISGLCRGDHPRRDRRRTVDPDAARTLRDGSRAGRRALHGSPHCWECRPCLAGPSRQWPVSRCAAQRWSGRSNCRSTRAEPDRLLSAVSLVAVDRAIVAVPHRSIVDLSRRGNAGCCKFAASGAPGHRHRRNIADRQPGLPWPANRRCRSRGCGLDCRSGR